MDLLQSNLAFRHNTPCGMHACLYNKLRSPCNHDIPWQAKPDDQHQNNSWTERACRTHCNGNVCRRFLNPYYHSSYDDEYQVSKESLVSSSVVLAHTLHMLATNTSNSTLKLDLAAVERNVLGLAACLIFDDPGMACPMATDLLVPGYSVVGDTVSFGINHYIRVFQGYQ